MVHCYVSLGFIVSGNALLSLILQEFFEILIRGKRVSKEWSFDTSFRFSSRGAIDSSRSTGMMRSKQQFEGVIKQCQWPISEVYIFLNTCRTFKDWKNFYIFRPNTSISSFS